MATSTSTLLEVANRVFLNANERTLSNLTPLIGQQVKECVRAAYYKILNENVWLWGSQTINADSWSTETATLPANTQRVRWVSWANDDGVRIPLTFQDQQRFYHNVLDSYNSTTQQGRALYYTLIDHNKVRVTPYPNDATERAKIWFHVDYIPPFPTLDSSIFPMPEDIIPLLVLCATAMFIKRHSDDASLAGSFETEYVIEMSQRKARQLTAPNYSINMYRGRKLSSYDVRW